MVGVNVIVANDGNIPFLQQETTKVLESEENNGENEKEPLLNKEFEAFFHRISHFSD